MTTEPIIVDTGASPWTMLLIALVSGLAATLPILFSSLRARAELKRRKDELALEELNRQEAQRKALEKAEAAAASAHAALAETGKQLAGLTSQIQAVSAAQEEAMAARTAIKAATEAQLAGIAAAVGVMKDNEPKDVQ